MSKVNMTKIDVIRPGSLHQIIGPVATLRRLLSCRDFFLNSGLDITIYNGKQTYQSLEDLNPISAPKVYGSKHKIVEWLNHRSNNSYVISVLLVEYKFQMVKRFIKSYFARERKSDAVVFHSPIESYWYLKLRKEKNTKCAVFFHSDCIPYELIFKIYPRLRGSKYEKVLLSRYKFVVDNADKLCCICEIGQKNLHKYYPNSIAKTALVINGITDYTKEEKETAEIIKTERKATKINLCCVGSVTIRKSQRKAIEAISLLPIEVRKRYHLTIVGGGADLEYCKEQVSKNDLDEIVSFTGAVPNAEVYKYLANSDVFVLLSENEGLPISIIEAMRAGLAVVSTNVSGIPELVSNNNGVLIKSDAREFANILSADNHDWKQMGKNSRELFEKKYTFDRMRQDYVDMVKSMFE